jgi:5-formyltetrahydrofolate cyclo-ligase
MTDSIDRSKQGNEDTAYRSEMRQARIRAREALPADRHAQLSASVLEHLHVLLAQRQAARLAFYWPIRAEIDCRPLVTRLIGQGWSACLPHIVDRSAAMTFRDWTPATAMINGEHGIPTVSDEASLQTVALPDVLLLPVNAFDREGFRLGYGGGYYDRTLAALPRRPWVVGVGFDLARVDSIRPHSQDHALDAVVTESGIERFSQVPPL